MVGYWRPTGRPQRTPGPQPLPRDRDDPTAVHLLPHDFGFGPLDLAATAYHSDEFYWDSNERIREPSYTTLSARASWRPRDSGFRLSLWGRNLTDEKHSRAVFLLETYDGISYARPRTYGVGVEYAF